MVIGLKPKNRGGSPTVQVDYIVHIQEVKPWPPSQSLRSLRSVLIQWENGDRSSGSTNPVIPSIGSIVGEGRIEFNESFKLRVTLQRDLSVKGGEGDTFQKNCLELNLYEHRRDKAVKGQSLATAIIDFADYGVAKETLRISAPMNCKRSFKKTDQPVLYVKLQPVEKRRSSSSKESLSRGAAMDHAAGESISPLMNEEYAEEAEVASFTDDDVSSHSSVTHSAFKSNGGSAPQNAENGIERVTNSVGGGKTKHIVASKPQVEKSNLIAQNALQQNVKGSSSCSSSVDLSSDLGSPVSNYASASLSPNSSSTKILKDVESLGVHSSSHSLVNENAEELSNNRVRSNDDEYSSDFHRNIANGRSNTSNVQQNGKNDQRSHDSYDSSKEDKDEETQEENRGEKQKLNGNRYSGEDESSIVQDVVREQVPMADDNLSLTKERIAMQENILKSDKLKHVKSVRVDPAKNGLIGSNERTEVKEIGQVDAQNRASNAKNKERKEAKVHPRDARTSILDSKIQQLEHRIKMLEGELREAAAIEAALYSVVADHGSSMSKVHAPARRLSRLYLHAYRESSQCRRATAARSAISGLVLVAKACGNDVPRLTFWLSNSVVLRTIISEATGDSELPISAGPFIKRNKAEKEKSKASPTLTWKLSAPGKREGTEFLYRSFGDWEEPSTFTRALEKIEAWIFSRIVESIWWQTLTPHMQSVPAKVIDKDIDSGSVKSYSRSSSSCDQEQGSMSLDLWKKAFKDAYERLCPVRAGGHDCGCLPELARLVMEQCVARLDVAMFNAILRESADEIPTDPVSDPISDSKVLPIPAGKSSFGAGAQLKNAIGNWSRWLTDIFGIDDEESMEDVNEHDDDDDDRQDTSFKSFHLLNALSDLMMLPKDLLLSKSVRKEVCPTFGAPLIRRILDIFVLDEFCPDPIPNIVFEALESEDSAETGEEAITNFPCTAAAITYLPPSTASIANTIGEIGGQAHLKRSGSSVLRKSYTSDDELDELNSPLSLILIDGSRASSVPTKPSWISKDNGNRNALRYELLREVWMDSE
ncbi:uncharacterized protein LOC107427853 [Ziziphus jujuba]|uniref:Uncharacterized protein LOC107427853 n=1 Tax=Ziziphus jujuba TaxID=326968 RepID=A0A6P4AEJ8_ZIZJJ|nr:uncharacterized protein LOC107427853 [Ziziphus jujuba]XP_015893736.3 uncharacterized protein LOC107427853 [Ziziphus jujuba]XP_048317797.2 uncharacterized protein LOC107427853 [Ziziphus jujuba]XP_048317798.2 uncharacterized protein LOC107427853 [Ziziphus jujuba]